MVSDTDLRHWGVKGMKWGVRTPHDKALGARKRAELAKLDISKLDQNAGLKRSKAGLDPTDKFAKKHYKLEARAVRADQRARRLETISKYSAPKPQSTNDRSSDGKFKPNDRNQNDRPNFDRKPPSDRTINQIAKTPYNPKDNKKNEGIFKRTVSAALVGVAGSAGNKVGEKYGEKLGERIINLMAKRAASAAAAGTTPPLFWSEDENLIDQLIHATPEPTIIDDILHYGVKGMKWGKERDPETPLDNDFGFRLDVTTDEEDLKGRGMTFESKYSKSGRTFKTKFYKIDRNKYEKAFTDTVDSVKDRVKRAFETDHSESIIDDILHYGVKGMKWDESKKTGQQDEMGALTRLGLNPYEAQSMVGKTFDQLSPDQQAKMRQVAAGLKPATDPAASSEVEYDPNYLKEYMKTLNEGIKKPKAEKKAGGKGGSGKKAAGKGDGKAEKALREKMVAEKKKATMATAKLKAELKAQKIVMDKLQEKAALAIRGNANLLNEARKKKRDEILSDPNLKRSGALMKYLRF